MFSGLPQATKSRTFSVERDKDSHTLSNCHTDVDANLSGSASTLDVCNNCLRIHWLKSVP